MKIRHTTGKEVVSVDTDQETATVQKYGSEKEEGPFPVKRYENHHDGSTTCDVEVEETGWFGRKKKVTKDLGG
jgi:hypothetical protein